MRRVRKLTFPSTYTPTRNAAGRDEPLPAQVNVNVRPELAEGGQTVVAPRTTKLIGSYKLTTQVSDRVESGEYLNGEVIAQVVRENFSQDKIQSTAKAAVQEVLSQAKYA